jgi:2-iminoacetate synthase
MTPEIPRSSDPRPWLERVQNATVADVRRALGAEGPGEAEMAALLSEAAGGELERMAQRARALTRRHFGRTIQLYVPLYLSNYCSSGCLYCGFSSDVDTPRRRLSPGEVEDELAALKQMGFEEVLLLTGERARPEDFAYLRDSVRAAAKHFHKVTVEVFPMSREEYHDLAEAGCTGVTLYQETYDPERYEALHRWGPKKDYRARLDAPARALAGGMRSMGIGALLGLSDPAWDMLALYRHAVQLRRKYWRSGLAVSFPRIRPQAGGYEPEFPVGERLLAQIIYAFRICLPDVPLVLSTRERPEFRDGMAGVGISKMSVASRTTVGGYGDNDAVDTGQFDVSDQRDVEAFCSMLREKGLEPVFKNWDMAYREPAWMEEPR